MTRRAGREGRENGRYPGRCKRILPAGVASDGGGAKKAGYESAGQIWRDAPARCGKAEPRRAVPLAAAPRGGCERNGYPGHDAAAPCGLSWGGGGGPAADCARR